MKEHSDGTAEWDPTFKEKDADGVGASSSNHEFHPNSSEEARNYLTLLATTGADVDGKDPLAFRLMLAISTDGEPPWEKTGMVIINHASVPCLAVEEVDGVETLYLFFVTSRDALAEIYNEDDSVKSLCIYNDDGVCIEKIRTTPLAVAYTTDLFTWTYRLLDCEAAGFEYEMVDAYGLELEDYSANDPSVVRAIGVSPDEKADPVSDYQWMMYYTLHYGDTNPSSAVTLVAFAHSLQEFMWTTGNDGLPVLPPDGAPGENNVTEAKAEDPSAIPIEIGDGGYLLFAGGNWSGHNWAASLSDGVTVDAWDQIQETCLGDDHDPIIMCNAVDAPGTSLHLTWIAAAGDNDLARYIVSLPFPWFESGTYDTSGECNVILKEDMDYEHNGIREAAVARFHNCWVMVYVTGIAFP